MREIKFRAWDKKYKYMTAVVGLRDVSSGFVGLNDNVVMQYTGLKDKNGVEIYEGDIVLFLDEEDLSNPSNGTYFEEFQNIGKVFYDECIAAYDITNRDCDRDDAFYEIQIIGNIYENPELLDNAK